MNCCCIVGAVVLPACCINLHIIQAVTEVISLGFATTVLPVAIAGAIFQVSRYRGRFHGLIRPAANSTEPCFKTHKAQITFTDSNVNTLSTHPRPQGSGWCSSGSPCGSSGCSLWCDGVRRMRRSGSCARIGGCPHSARM